MEVTKNERALEKSNCKKRPARNSFIPDRRLPFTNKNTVEFTCLKKQLVLSFIEKLQSVYYSNII